MSKISNGRSVESNGSNAISNAQNAGGITGKGFKKGQSGNPSGRKKGHVLQVAPEKKRFAFSNYLRDWLMEKAWVRDIDGNKVSKETRLETLIECLAKTKPEVIFNYAFGKPVEVHEVAAAEGTELEFIVRVNGKDVP